MEVFLQIYNFLNGILNDLLEKGVSVYLYVPSSPKADKRLCYNISLRCKVLRGLPPIQIVLVDDKYVILHPAEAESSFPIESEWIIIHMERYLMFSVKSYFVSRGKILISNRNFFSRSQKFLF